MSPDGPARHPGLSPAQKRDWLRLIRSENVGPVTFRALINRFGGAAEALEALPALSARGGLSRPIRLASREDAEAELEAAEAMGAELVAWGDEGYPPIFAHLDAAPPLLYAKGRRELLAAPMIAIVGARNASAGGRRIAADMAREIGRAGYVVVSGLARGVDASAHHASLDTGTVAVLAGGIGRIYPPENLDLAHEIAQRGALLTEMPPHWVPRGQDFPRRNRIIAGLAVATVVVEAARRSGSLITARLAGEMGREILAVPGSPLDPRADGTNMLIRQGATLARSAEDVIEAVTPLDPRRPAGLARLDERAPQPVVPQDPGEDERGVVLEALSPMPVEIDEIIRQMRTAGGGRAHVPRGARARRPARAPCRAARLAGPAGRPDVLTLAGLSDVLPLRLGLHHRHLEYEGQLGEPCAICDLHEGGKNIGEILRSVPRVHGGGRGVFPPTDFALVVHHCRDRRLALRSRGTTYIL